MNNKYTAIIVEDEIENIKLLNLLLQKYCHSVEVIGQARCANDFVDSMTNLKPDILLLDIDLGEKLNSLEILDRLTVIDTEVIITSSYKKYAINAINHHNISGYLVKPIKVIELKEVITSAIQNINERKLNHSDAHNKKEFLSNNVIAIPTATSIYFINNQDITHLHSEGKYTTFHLVDGTKYVVSKNLGEYQKLLPQHIFFRIHHRYIANLMNVKSIQRSDGHYCQFINNVTLPIAKRRQEDLRRFLQLRPT